MVRCDKCENLHHLGDWEGFECRANPKIDFNERYINDERDCKNFKEEKENGI